MDRPVRGQPCPQSGISTQWNNRMAFAQIFGDGTFACTVVKFNSGIWSADVLTGNLLLPGASQSEPEKRIAWHRERCGRAARLWTAAA